MLLHPDEANLFFAIQRALFVYVNEQLNVVASEALGLDSGLAWSPDSRYAVRNAWLEHLELTESFVSANPAGLHDEALAIARSWRNPICGSFFVLRDLSKYSIFFPTANDPV